MAELDPEKVGRLGVDPGTGSPLSQEVRNTLLKKSTIDASIFLSSENKRRESDAQNTKIIQEQGQALLGFGSNIQALRADIGKLGTGLASIALLLQQDSIEEQSKIKTDQEQQRILTERKIRIGKESDIEQKIQNAISEPVERLAPKVDDIFGRIGSALGILFGGWLTVQVAKAMKASEEGNTKLFNDIKFNIIKNVGIVVGGLVAIKVGFSLITRTISGIAFGLTRLLIAKPLAIAAALLPRPGAARSPGGPKPGGPKPGPGSNIGKIGKFVTFLSGLMNIKNKEFIDATLAALTFAARAPGPLGAIGKIAGIAFTADEIAEAFGKNIFEDANLNKKVDEISQIFKKDDKTSNTSSKPTPAAPAPSPAAPAPTPAPSPAESTPTPAAAAPAPAPAAPAAAPIVQPQTPMMGEQTPSTSSPSPDMEKKFEQAWQYRNRPMARGRIEGAWNEMTSEQKQQAKTWAQTKGYNWDEMKLKDPSPSMMPAPSTTQPLETTISPAQVSSPIKPPTQVGDLPEPKPSVTMIKTSNNQQQQQNVPLTSGELTNVPLINSANPDNFYVLYSQLNYNVVI